tara:strand:- start:12456 stop:13295 length:840 start_codon:yes stop_codon:yes gene_type:complete
VLRKVIKRIQGKKNSDNPKIAHALELQPKNFFWNPKDGTPNIGDYLAFETVNFVLNLRDKHATHIEHGKILSIGSVLHFAQDNDVIWGTGRNGKIADTSHFFTNVDVRAVRGPRTAKFLADKGIEVPKIFGDPGILSPLIYPVEALNSVNKQHSKEVAIVPQLNDDMSIYRAYNNNLISPRQLPGNFISQIVTAKKVISSSLHGLILAEAYGIPAVYFDSGSGENIFKYHDYYEGTGRNKFAIGKSIEECMDLSTVEIPDLKDRQINLIANFPFDRYCK